MLGRLTIYSLNGHEAEGSELESQMRGEVFRTTNLAAINAFPNTTSLP